MSSELVLMITLLHHLLSITFFHLFDCILVQPRSDREKTKVRFTLQHSPHDPFPVGQIDQCGCHDNLLQNSFHVSDTVKVSTCQCSICRKQRSTLFMRFQNDGLTSEKYIFDPFLSFCRNWLNSQSNIILEME